MIIPFPPRFGRVQKTACEKGKASCRQAAVYSIFTPAKAPNISTKFKPESIQCSGFPKFNGRPGPWDGGDAA